MNKIAVKGKQNNLIVTLPVEGTTNQLIADLGSYLERTGTFFRNGRVTLDVGHRQLERKELTVFREANLVANYPVNMEVKPDVRGFFDKATNTISYIVKDPNSNCCAIIDSVMDIDYAAGRITYDHADELISLIEKEVKINV